tara:strand:+ start:1372 stop:1542 length:171 start_codon:yes stop_codon:yes gene_type:complete
MSKTDEKIWTIWISIKQWFSRLFKSEMDAIIDPYENNEPPKIGEQPYRDKPLSKWR